MAVYDDDDGAVGDDGAYLLNPELESPKKEIFGEIVGEFMMFLVSDWCERAVCGAAGCHHQVRAASDREMGLPDPPSLV